MLWYVCSTLKTQENHKQILRDSRPQIVLHLTGKSAEQCNKTEKLLHDACKEYFVTRHGSKCDFQTEFQSEQVQLLHGFKNAFYPLGVKCAINESKQPLQNKQLIHTRLQRVFEHHATEPLPHQQRVLEYMWTQLAPLWQKQQSKDGEEQQEDWHWAFLLYWAMGSGKSIGALQLFSFLFVDEVIILCQNTTIPQWARFVAKLPQPANSRTVFQIIGLNEYGRILDEDNSHFLRGKCVIFDEAHFFRNVTAGMQVQIAGLREAKILLNLTGTPLINSVNDFLPLCLLHNVTFTKQEVALLRGFTEERDEEAKTQNIERERAVRDLIRKSFSNHVHFYDPRVIPAHMKDYATFEIRKQMVPMSWVQTLEYMMAKRQNFEIGSLCISTAQRNCYHRAELRLSNSSSKNRSSSSSSDSTVLSNKFAAIAANIQQGINNGEYPQLVFSHFLDNGIIPLFKHVSQVLDSKKHPVGLITGQVASLQRDGAITDYNARKLDVLFLSKVGETGVDFMNTRRLHLTDSSESFGEESQIIGRALRFRAHQPEADGTIKPVIVFKYISTFPSADELRKNKQQQLELENYFFDNFIGKKRGKKEEYIDFDFCECLVNKIQEEELGRTIDERLEISNSYKQSTLLPILEELQCIGHI